MDPGRLQLPEVFLGCRTNPSIKPGCGLTYIYICDDFVTMLDDFGLVQMVTEPNRGENVFDLFLTSNYTLIKKIEIFAGIADHHIMVADVDVKPTISMQKPRSAPLYRKADWNNFKKYTTNFASDFMLNYHDKTVEKLWDSFKTTIK